MNIQTKRTFDSFLKENGHYILVGHTKMKNHCDCYNTSTKEGDPNCPYCFGVGWNYRWYATKARRTQHGESLSSSSDRMELDAPIKFSGNTFKYYVKTENDINDFDLLIEFDIPENRQEYNLYLVSNHMVFRGEKGNPVYKGILAIRIVIDYNQIVKSLKLLNIEDLEEV